GTGAHLRQGVDWAVNCQVDLPGYQILHGRGRAAVRHVLEASVSKVLEQNPTEVTDAADPCCALRGLVRVRLQPSDETFQVIGWHGLSCNNENRIVRKHCDRLKILQHVVLARVKSAIHDVRIPSTEDQRVAGARCTVYT